MPVWPEDWTVADYICTAGLIIILSGLAVLAWL